MEEIKSTPMKSARNMSGRINWFPGHMAKALKKVKEKIGKVDIVVEIRDARVPLASGNPSIKDVIGGKHHLIVMNKTNLADSNTCRKWEKWFKQQVQPAVFVNAMQPKSLKKITNSCREMMQSRWRKFKEKGIQPPPLRLIIVGIPNTGKSTIINRLTNRNAAQTGDRPGVTRNQEWIILGRDLELLDTPGIMPPRIETEEEGMWLCSIHAVKDEIIGKDQVAAYVINQLLNIKSEHLKKRYQLNCLDHNAEELMLLIGKQLNYKKRQGEIDLIKTYGQVLQDFRKGLLGPFSFEVPPDL
jgi:ribosome biogenesis GTPase A